MLSDKTFPLSQETVVGIDACAATEEPANLYTNQPTFTLGLELNCYVIRCGSSVAVRLMTDLVGIVLKMCKQN